MKTYTNPVSAGRRNALRHATAGVVALALGGCGDGASDAQTPTTDLLGPSLPPVTSPAVPSPALVISGVKVDAVLSDSAVISWQTSLAATATVEYGPTMSYGQSQSVGPAAAGTHSMSLSGLLPATLYHFRVLCSGVDGNGNPIASTDLTFTTAGVAATGRVTLEWDGVTQNADAAATPLLDLAGYRLYMSTTSGSYPAVAARHVNAMVTGGVLQTSVTGLARGTYFFVVTALDAYGNESAHSEEVRVVIS